MTNSTHTAAIYGAMLIQDCPLVVPWPVIAPHEEQARKNHSQSLATLAERGGLCASEAVAVLENRPWRSMDRAAAMTRLESLGAKRKAAKP